MTRVCRLDMQSPPIMKVILIMHLSLVLTWVGLQLTSHAMLESTSMSLRVPLEVSPYKHHRYIPLNLECIEISHQKLVS